MNYEIELDGRKHRLSILRGTSQDACQVLLDGKPCSADPCLLEPDILSLLIEGKSFRVLFDSRAGSPTVVVGERRIPYRVEDPRSLRSRTRVGANEAGPRSILAPMPGRIVRVLVAPGAQVEAQQGLIVVEAMKMQNELKAPRAGSVSRISVEVGATVQAGDILLVIE